MTNYVVFCRSGSRVGLCLESGPDLVDSALKPRVRVSVSGVVGIRPLNSNLGWSTVA